ncbi:MAG: hypothetical protein AAGE01_05280 [Pseudomonadota bacterium]
MRRTRPIHILLGLALLVGCAAHPPELRVQRWSAVLGPDETIAVVNRFGDIHVRTASAGFVGLTAVAQCRAGREVIVSSPRPGGIHIHTDGTGCARIDVALHVAPGHPVSLETGDGRISSRGIDNPVSARSVTGEVRLQSSGTMDATTEAGAIVLRPLRPKWRGRHVARSGSGTIRALAPRRHVAVTACAASVSIEASLGTGEDDTGCVRFQRGTGASAFDLASERGRIEIIDSTRPLEAVTGGPLP